MVRSTGRGITRGRAAPLLQPFSSTPPLSRLRAPSIDVARGHARLPWTPKKSALSRRATLQVAPSLFRVHDGVDFSHRPKPFLAKRGADSIARRDGADSCGPKPRSPLRGPDLWKWPGDVTEEVCSRRAAKEGRACLLTTSFSDLPIPLSHFGGRPFAPTPQSDARRVPSSARSKSARRRCCRRRQTSDENVALSGRRWRGGRQRNGGACSDPSGPKAFDTLYAPTDLTSLAHAFSQRVGSFEMVASRTSARRGPSLQALFDNHWDQPIRSQQRRPSPPPGERL